MRLAATLLLAVVGLGVLGCGTDEEETVNIGLIWSDEFEGDAGDPPDPAKWTYDLGTGWGNNQLEYTTDRVTNVSLDGEGHLAITARRESFNDCDYTAARIKTQGLFAHGPGRFEARIKLPIGQGIWPAFWMLGDDFPGVSWPDCGEIDVMEYRGQEPRVLVGSLHGPGYAGSNPVTARHELSQGGFHLGFHVFSIDWDDTGIAWSVDGYVYHTATPADLPAGTQWVFDHPFFLLLNVAVGGNWVGDPDETTEFPQTMLVDWVRVYGESGSGS